ncbi:leucyl aminopeptidase [Notoacmeibacter sp. MSK16QG-6]|uniref:leucyl aminopeptidase n=1 Tax=Notoacmeibacter sp. MSK16QG-6 TaxID=2957982 RepID=UPI00209E8479|nr:leucyl aminopeptidase [Notoacmeibacter sp. MSK16QG-6]MCP1197975.1 leucyl aminopeptidase [Notoacmeibacter sp. MSK16QG-6]
MSLRPEIRFAPFSTPTEGCVILLAGEGGVFSERAKEGDPDSALDRAAAEMKFKGKLAGKLDILVPGGTNYSRIVAIGVGPADKRQEHDFIRIGGAAYAALRAGQSATAVLDAPDGPCSTDEVVRFAMGFFMRSYSFDTYKTKKKSDDEDNDEGAVKLTIQCDDPDAATASWKSHMGVAEGVLAAREVVDLPANVLGPVEFADKAEKLSEKGVEVEILGWKEMEELGMGALLGVSQGSERPPRLVVMRWNGGAEGEKPVAFIGKGVVFDTGGISIKPAGGMEDMKGDMGGAAAVYGLMHALSARKAKANVVGVIGLVENMPDGKAQRPGDIVTSMSGQTIEVINTDAEGRLVLGDALHYVRDRFDPKFMIDLATLTGAVIIALGNEYAGLFSNDDDLAGHLMAAGEKTNEKVWRLPLGDAYDKLIDSKNADMKNTGGRPAGSITAAQFLKRFVGETPWAHLDVAGTAMGSPKNEISSGWASGFGVRLLDRLVRDNYEDGEA